MAEDLLIEIGSEEIPASFIVPALDNLEAGFRERATQARLPHGDIKRFGTPRRLALVCKQVAARTADISRQVLGPPARVAFDPSGKLTKAGEKFAEGQKVPVEKIQRVQTPKGEYIAVQVEEAGRAATVVLAEILHPLVHSINFRKSMRWGDVDLAFARPVHWVVALYGGEVVPLVLGDVRSGRTTYGHRFLAPQPIELGGPGDYEAALDKAKVVPEIGARRALVLARVQAAARAAGGELRLDEALLDQVTNLVELPNPVVGTFDERHLDLPPEVLVQEMQGHQRYFPMVSQEGRLLPRFVAVSNTPVRDDKISVRGYERVLRARLADGRFFFDEDRRTSLESRVEKLGRVVWQGALGSYLEKVERMRALAKAIVPSVRAGGDAGLGAVVDRAALLCKADLVTSMVGEFPELQGVMGREYARAGGESEETARAIHEHYLPRFAEDALPSQDGGAIVGLADRLDSICGLFAIGKAPTGAADPFGLRRACLAVLNIVLGRGYRVSLAGLIDASLALYGKNVSAAQIATARGEVLEFFRGRLKALWTEDHRSDVVTAVLSAGFDDVVAAQRRLAALSGVVGEPDFVPLAIAFKRVMNIIEKQAKDVAPGPADPAKFADPSEHELHRAYLAAQVAASARIKTDDYLGALAEIAKLKPAIDAFFDKVMVMAEDRAVRENRVRLLSAIGALFAPLADFSKLQVEL